MKTKKPPVIRRGQKKAYVKATNDEIERRVEETAFLLAAGSTKSDLHQAIGQKYNLHWRTVDIYIARARAFLLKQANKTRDEVRADAVNFYESILKNPTSTTRERLQARTRLDEIYGIDAPRRTELSGPDGKPMQVQTKTEPQFDISTLSKEEVLAIDSAIAKHSTPPRPLSRN